MLLLKLRLCVVAPHLDQTIDEWKQLAEFIFECELQKAYSYPELLKPLKEAGVPMPEISEKPLPELPSESDENSDIPF